GTRRRPVKSSAELIDLTNRIDLDSLVLFLPDENAVIVRQVLNRLECVSESIVPWNPFVPGGYHPAGNRATMPEMIVPSDNRGGALSYSNCEPNRRTETLGGSPGQG